MSEMVRKTFYITPHQSELLKRLAQIRGVSVAEIIRQAIDREAEHAQHIAVQDDHSVWEELLQLVEERKRLGITGEPYHWNRQEIYEERENRWLGNRSHGSDNLQSES